MRPLDLIQLIGEVLILENKTRHTLY
jgi:hypothetical protein